MCMSQLWMWNLPKYQASKVTHYMPIKNSSVNRSDDESCIWPWGSERVWSLFFPFVLRCPALSFIFILLLLYRDLSSGLIYMFFAHFFYSGSLLDSAQFQYHQYLRYRVVDRNGSVDNSLFLMDLLKQVLVRESIVIVVNRHDPRNATKRRHPMSCLAPRVAVHRSTIREYRQRTQSSF